MSTAVYILWSYRLKKLYIGITSDLDRRLKEHDRGKSLYSKSGAPWKLVWRCCLKKSRAQAMQLEKTLKNLKSRNRIQAFIEKYAEDKI